MTSGLVRRWGAHVSKPLLNADLAAVLAGDPPASLPWGIVQVEGWEIGSLAVPTGRLVACDPLMIGKPVPFALRTRKGRFPVQLFIAQYEGGDQRIAAARLQFARGVPDRWDMAVTADEDASTIEPGDIIGYPVDSGTGSLMDLKAAKRLAAQMHGIQRYFDMIEDKMEENYVHTRSWAMIDLGDGDELNAAVFSSGLGDGLYASYWGWSGAKLLCLVTDFGLFYSEADDD